MKTRRGAGKRTGRENDGRKRKMRTGREDRSYITRRVMVWEKNAEMHITVCSFLAFVVAKILSFSSLYDNGFATSSSQTECTNF